jgi:hypothetical protein
MNYRAKGGETNFMMKHPRSQIYAPSVRLEKESTLTSCGIATGVHEVVEVRVKWHLCNKHGMSAGFAIQSHHNPPLWGIGLPEHDLLGGSDLSLR